MNNGNLILTLLSNVNIMITLPKTLLYWKRYSSLQPTSNEILLIINMLMVLKFLDRTLFSFKGIPHKRHIRKVALSNKE